jgi:hypothetical protein
MTAVTRFRQSTVDRTRNELAVGCHRFGVLDKAVSYPRKSCSETLDPQSRVGTTGNRELRRPRGLVEDSKTSKIVAPHI